MRTHLFLAAIALVGCKWTDFDDLSDETWVRSVEDPDIGAGDYAVEIAGVTTGASGGTLAVLSDDTANYSTIVYDSDGVAEIGPNPVKLGTQNIGAIAEAPAFVADASRVGLVEKSINLGNYAILFGSPTAPTGIEFTPLTQPPPSPDAAAFTNTTFVFAAGDIIYTVAPSNSNMPTACAAKDNQNMPLQVAAMAADANNLWVWTKGGAFFSYPLSAIFPCTGGMVPSPGNNAFITMNFNPAPGARVHIVGQYAILTGHPATSRAGQVFVVNTTNMTAVGTPLALDGLDTSIVAAFDNTTYLVVGIPDRSVDGVVAGEVELYPINTTTGMLDAAPVLTLHDAEPYSGQTYGRALTTMDFNGGPILVVGANNEVFAYYKTALYDRLP